MAHTARIPDRRTLRTLKTAARGCRACDLWRRATQTVFGEGKTVADVMLVGEQPGNEEDLSGHPFVGPAGRILSDALARAGIDRNRTYVTNVVKHFKWEPRGKRRIHARPKASEIGACRPWLDAEIAVVGPRIIVCLGATAAKTLLGSSFRVSVDRGRFVESALAPLLTATVHPSSILREPDPQARREAMNAFVNDLKKVAAKLRGRLQASGSGLPAEPKPEARSRKPVAART
jgi:uracil-DNA glycosylase family protein